MEIPLLLPHMKESEGYALCDLAKNQGKHNIFVWLLQTHTTHKTLVSDSAEEQDEFKPDLFDPRTLV